MRVSIRRRGEPDSELIEDAKRVAAANGLTTLTRAQYDRDGEWSSSQLVRRLGSWARVCELAGLTTGRPDLGHDHQAWMMNIFDVWVRLGRQPVYQEVATPLSRFSAAGYAHRYGSWTDALLAFQAWLDAQGGTTSTPSPEAPIEISKRRRAPSLRLRWQVLQRDQFRCVACGSSPAHVPGVVLHIDHISPYSRGGETALENLQTLCDRCNYGKTDSVPALHG